MIEEARHDVKSRGLETVYSNSTIGFPYLPSLVHKTHSYSSCLIGYGLHWQGIPLPF